MQLNKQDWQTVSFGDVVSQGKGTVDPETSGLERYIAGEHMVSEDLHIRQWGTVGDGYLGPAFHRPFEKGDILYGSRRTYLKKVAVADFDGITSNTTFVIKENLDLVVPGFVPFLMLSYRFTEHSIKNSKGSVNPYINFKDIAKLEFRLPPLDVQARLTDLLWAADEVGERYRQLRSELYGCYTTLLEDTFANLADRLDCKVSSIGQEVKLVNGSAYNALDWVKEGLPIVRIQNLNGNAEYNYFNGSTKGKVVIDTNDLLFAWSGNRGTSFGPYVWQDGKGVLNQHIFRLDFDEKKLHKAFLFEYLKYLTVEIERQAHGAIGLVHITKGALEDFRLDIPSFKAQEQIAKQLEAFNSRILEADVTIKQANNLMNQIINQIFAA
jgi:type I restriction enzyme S subunit